MIAQICTGVAASASPPQSLDLLCSHGQALAEALEVLVTRLPETISAKGRLPDVSQLRESVKDMRTPHAVRSKFWGMPKFVDLHIETHALAPTSASPVWRADEFGILTKDTVEAVSNLRIVQLGWVRSGDGPPVIKTKLVKPDGFEIEQGATDKHHITHQAASENGLSMQVVLRAFLDDVTAAVGEGHRLCAHLLGFDAGIFLKEMGCVGLHDRTEEWMQLVSPGLCSMDPSIGQWVREQIGVWDVPRKIPMRFKDAVAHLLPNNVELLSLHHAGTTLTCMCCWRRSFTDALTHDSD